MRGAALRVPEWEEPTNRAETSRAAVRTGVRACPDAQVDTPRCGAVERARRALRDTEDRWLRGLLLAGVVVPIAALAWFGALTAVLAALVVR
jgi:hypothetical protein